MGKAWSRAVVYVRDGTVAGGRYLVRSPATGALSSLTPPRARSAVGLSPAHVRQVRGEREEAWSRAVVHVRDGTFEVLSVQDDLAGGEQVPRHGQHSL